MVLEERESETPPAVFGCSIVEEEARSGSKKWCEDFFPLFPPPVLIAEDLKNLNPTHEIAPSLKLARPSLALKF